ncbi:hypothetical protein [Gracilimonas sp.]|uniref:hypothetical protein n=1 Tax=Gracilimonas sp. TaxID=1974203 RepID=UPI003BACD86A
MGRAMLFLVSGLVIISGIIQMANMNRTEVLPERTAIHFNEQQAKNVASSLIDNAIQNLLVDMEWSNEISMSTADGATGTLYMTQPDPDDEYRVLLTSYGTYGGYQSEIEVLMQRDSFSRYSYFTDAETFAHPYTHVKIWWWNGDQVTGPVHTNGTFSMSGSPTFNGFISSPNDWVGYTGDETSSDPATRHGSDSPNFNGGTNFNLTKTKDLPGTEQINLLKTQATLDFNSSKDVEFYEDILGEGYVKVKNTGCTDPIICYTHYRLANYQGPDGGVVISVDGDANVVGEVKGSVTLHASQNINIMGDIVYDTDPRIDSTSTDLLGLVSEQNVIIDRYAHSYNGSYDLTIHASIMALGTSFEAEDYSSGSPRGSLDLLGGVIQKNRGPVGTFSGGSVASGYTKNYVYDTRLQQTIPPSFPRESIFSLVYWRDKPVVKVNL